MYQCVPFFLVKCSVFVVVVVVIIVQSLFTECGLLGVKVIFVSSRETIRYLGIYLGERDAGVARRELSHIIRIVLQCLR